MKAERGAFIDKLVKAVSRARDLALKAQQKINLIDKRIILKFLNGLILSTPKVTTLQKAERQVRAVIKDVFHIQPRTDNVLYATKRDGGMGIPRLDKLAHLAILRSGLALLASGDVGVSLLA
jgi:hypothetical protein